MSDRFKALLVTRDRERQSDRTVALGPADLMEGNVTIAVSHSTLNYKDALALTGRSPVVRRFPMIPGIDLAGIVETSGDAAFAPGDRVMVNGFGVGETHYGGYSQRARVKSDWLVKIPEAFSCAEAMAIGTAGYTAMLAVLALEDAGVSPHKGAVAVTGASGGLGSVAVALLSGLGYRVIASTGRPEEQGYLTDLGASEVIARGELASEPRPLAKERWLGAVDSVGATTLANLIAATHYGGAVAACGLTGGLALPTSVAPFILRGVSLLGIESVYMNMGRRRQAWARLARDLEGRKLAAMTRTIDLEGVCTNAEEMLAGRTRGRLVVRLS